MRLPPPPKIARPNPPPGALTNRDHYTTGMYFVHLATLFKMKVPAVNDLIDYNYTTISYHEISKERSYMAVSRPLATQWQHLLYRLIGSLERSRAPIEDEWPVCCNCTRGRQ